MARYPQASYAELPHSILGSQEDRPAMALTVVCLVDRRRNTLSRGMRKAGFTVVEAFTTDQAVAVCVSRQIDAVVLDQEFFVEVDGWSVAQSIKLVKPSICVVLAARAKLLGKRLPKGV